MASVKLQKKTPQKNAKYMPARTGKVLLLDMDAIIDKIGVIADESVDKNTSIALNGVIPPLTLIYGELADIYG